MKKKLFVGLVTVIMTLSLMVSPAFAAILSYDTAATTTWGVNGGPGIDDFKIKLQDLGVLPEVAATITTISITTDQQTDFFKPQFITNSEKGGWNQKEFEITATGLTTTDWDVTGKFTSDSTYNEFWVQSGWKNEGAADLVSVEFKDADENVVYSMGIEDAVAEEEVTEDTAAEATSYDAVAEFDSTSATGENGPWGYNVTTDEGATFTPCTVLEAQDGLTPWHPVAGNWTGVGLNGDVPDFVELNADGKGGSYGALSFKAPEDGTYDISGLVKNPWDQTAELLHARLNGTDLFTAELGGSEADPTAFETTGVALKAGEEVFFFCPSSTVGGWMSAYVQVVITLEDTAVTEDTAATTTDVPKTGVVGLGLLFGAGAIVTGTLSLKKKAK